MFCSFSLSAKRIEHPLTRGRVIRVANAPPSDHDVAPGGYPLVGIGDLKYAPRRTRFAWRPTVATSRRGSISAATKFECFRNSASCKGPGIIRPANSTKFGGEKIRPSGPTRTFFGEPRSCPIPCQTIRFIHGVHRGMIPEPKISFSSTESWSWFWKGSWAPGRLLPRCSANSVATWDRTTCCDSCPARRIWN